MIEQMSIFDYLNNNKYINNSKLKLLSLFSGIGAFEKALNNIGVDYELVNYCEIDKYASKSYSLIHNVSEDKNLWDVTKVDTSKLPKDIDLITYGFPCQDISLAGKQQGLFNEDGTKTRSGLFFEALRIIENTKPKFAIAENVKNLVSKKFKNEFEIVLKSLEETGYNNYYQVLNAKDYGIPQNRERVFIVSIRKDIDTGYTFPKPLELKLRLKDMLEDEVHEKYYLSDDLTKKIINSNFVQEKARIQRKDICDSLLARDYKSPKCVIVLGNYSPSGHNASKIVDINGIAPIVMENHGTVTGIIYKEKTKSLSLQNIHRLYNGYCSRKLIPKEYWRLMGFNDEDFEKASSVNSNTQLYKQAGNSIVVNVLEEIFKQLL